MNAPRKPPVFATFGCRLNAYETEAMKDLAARAGLEGAVVVNTCAVTAEAVRKARKEIRRLARENPGVPLIVTGCAAQTEPQTFTSMDEVTHVIGNTEKMQAETWRGLAPDLIGQTEQVQVDDIMSVTETAGHLIDGFGSRARAYVQVQNGCDHRCTFCIIPYGRGNSRSVPAGVVVDQIARLVDRGYNEVVLTGVDLTSWGADLPGTPRLGDLVRRILRLTDVPRLRISSIDSIEADPALMEAIATEPRLMPHLHLSLQSGDDLILKRMKRRHLRDDAIAFCEEARRLRPDMVFGADIIVGFPTETEAMFENSRRLVEECGLTWLHVFPYSAREGTPAAKIPARVDGATIKARAARLRGEGEAAVARHLSAQVGQRHNVLMENARMGRTEQFTEVHFAADQPVGRIVEARIAGVEGAHLRAPAPERPAPSHRLDAASKRGLSCRRKSEGLPEMKLIMSPASPFVRKVRVILREGELTDLVAEHPVSTTPLATPQEVRAANPTGKIPVLVRDDGPAIHDSRVITRFLDDRFELGLYPESRLWEVLTLEAMADGIMDAAVLMVYEHRFRPEPLWFDDWTEAQWGKVTGGLDAIENRWMSHLAGPLNAAQIAVGCALSYLDFRHPGRPWRGERPALAEWHAAFGARPAMVATAPD